MTRTKHAAAILGLADLFHSEALDRTLDQATGTLAPNGKVTIGEAIDTAQRLLLEEMFELHLTRGVLKQEDPFDSKAFNDLGEAERKQLLARCRYTGNSEMHFDCALGGADWLRDFKDCRLAKIGLDSYLFNCAEKAQQAYKVVCGLQMASQGLLLSDQPWFQ